MPRPTTNPYIAQLAQSLTSEPNCDLLLFSFAGAIFRKYDAFHVHWPEVIYRGSSPLKSLRRQILTAGILTRIQLTKTALVRTRHNIARPSGLNRREEFLDRWFDRLTTLDICLNDAAEETATERSMVIPHGHYREWFTPAIHISQVRGRLTYFGLIRRYKGVDGLVSSFLGTLTPGLTLSVSGNPSTPSLKEELISRAGSDSGVSFDFKFLSDTELVSVVTLAELVILPYLFMHNSGAALAALSLNRPVLVPDTEVNRALSQEVGPGWIYLFDGVITAEAIDAAILALRAEPPVVEPNLDARSWETMGAQHVSAFRVALGLKGGSVWSQEMETHLRQLGVRVGARHD
ncbi:glycosyl transferase [Arthrobacter cryoconiti]|uniref:Glycosyl transferase n=1 Tax=Arthrobacter cryoconiti TaxID=748907 RepID=A0ABV8R6K4_9MICC|nr:glycosyl transferase [Arthrobacter cryoconiti]MCC9067011.1 glycosyl transferase [Arthrobacter cryoconiti]